MKKVDLCAKNGAIVCNKTIELSLEYIYNIIIEGEELTI